VNPRLEFSSASAWAPVRSNADKVPYYLLLVATHLSSPTVFQYQLDVQYAVGRLAFDRADDYAYYALSVVQVEKGPEAACKPRHVRRLQSGDRATAMSADYLVQPLAEKLLALQPEWAGQVQAAGGSYQPWEVQTILKEQATKASLSALLESKAAPALLFSATHGISFPNGDSRQAPHQGALICQDWPGPITGARLSLKTSTSPVMT